MNSMRLAGVFVGDSLVRQGNIAMIGILPSMAASIFLLPGWRQQEGGPAHAPR